MKYLLTFLLLISTLHSDDAKQKITLGLGIYAQSMPYKDVSTLLIPSPVIFFDNGIAYVRWSRAGIYFLGDKSEDLSWGFSITGQPRTFGYKASDSSYLKGMDERKTSLEAGLAFSIFTNGLSLESMLLTDVLDRYDSWIFKTEITKEYTFKDFTFYPTLTLTYESDDFMNYYYGVQNHEADSSLNREAYIAKGGLQTGLQTYIEYPFTDNLSTLINLRVDLLPVSAQNSPIVDNNYIYSGLASLIYTFQY